MLSWVLSPRSLRLAAAPQRAPGARQHPGDLLGSPCSPRTGHAVTLRAQPVAQGGWLGDR